MAENRLAKYSLISLGLLFVSLFILLPLTALFLEALKGGWHLYWQAVVDPEALSALRLTLLICLIVVPINTIFGISIAWAVSKFNFKGKNILISLVELPFSISPVIVGLMYLLTWGSNSFIAPWLTKYNIAIIFALPGMVLATLFITLPFVARNLITLMSSQGKEEEEAALLLGASGWQSFRYITLPKIKWGLIYSILLCNARALSEFGAVAVISGHIRGKTNTMPLYVEALYNNYDLQAACAVSTILILAALLTLSIKTLIEGRHKGEIKALRH